MDGETATAITVDPGMSINRWNYYSLLRASQLSHFWAERLSGDTNLLCILGLGFDPRTCDAIRMLKNAGGTGRRDVILIQFDEGPDSPSHNFAVQVAENRQRLVDLLNGTGELKPRQLKVKDDDGRRVESVNAARLFSNVAEFANYQDVIFDISALPRGIYFPILAKLLHLHDEGRRIGARTRLPSIHVLVAENAGLDTRIRQEGVDESASFVHGFSGGAQQEASASVPCVWMPLLGEGQEQQFRVIQDFVKPSEVLPVLPSPARNPRRADDLVVEYREILFDSLRLDPRNFIYAHEQNPFEVYRQLHSVIARYRRSLHPLGGARFVLSGLSSKLMSLGPLLVAYELKQQNIVGLAHVSSNGYQFDDVQPNETTSSQTELFGLSVAGEYYE
jgi:hypothetical protein